MRLYSVSVMVDNGMERFHTSWLVFSENEQSAREWIKKKYDQADIVKVTSSWEIKPVEGMAVLGHIFIPE